MLVSLKGAVHWSVAHAGYAFHEQGAFESPTKCRNAVDAHSSSRHGWQMSQASHPIRAEQAVLAQASAAAAEAGGQCVAHPRSLTTNPSKILTRLGHAVIGVRVATRLQLLLEQDVFTVRGWEEDGAECRMLWWVSRNGIWSCLLAARSDAVGVHQRRWVSQSSRPASAEQALPARRSAAEAQAGRK